MFLPAAEGARAFAADLTGLWASDDGAIYYVRQIGNTVWWAGFDPDPFSPVRSKSNSFHRGLTSTQVFQGTLSGNTVRGEWTEVPRQSAFNLNQGTLTIAVNLDPAGNALSMQLQSQAGGLTAKSWTKASIPKLPCADNAGQRDPYCLFAKVLKNQTESVWGSHESLLDNLKPYKDNAVVFGTVVSPYAAGTYPANCADFFANNAGDDDLNFDMVADRANLDAQPGFWTDGWRNPAANVQAKLNAWQNAIHSEAIAYGRQDSQCQASGPVFLPGWGEAGANSSLSQGVPIAGSLSDVGNTVAINESPQMKQGSRVRVTGAIVLDCGHGLTSPCYDTENDPNNPESRNLEIHPVYSVEILQDFAIQRPPNIDLTGSWAASDVGTYYVRQIGDAIWWLGLSSDQGLTFANVFHGTLQSGVPTTGPRVGTTGTAGTQSPAGLRQPPGSIPVIRGQWTSLPLGRTQGDGSLTLSGNFCKDLTDPSVPCDAGGLAPSWNVLATQTCSSPLFANPSNGRFQWQKLYDLYAAATPHIVVPQTVDMGRIANGMEANGSVPVSNTGTAPLIVQSISGSLLTLTFNPRTMTVAPGATADVSVRWLVANATRPGMQTFNAYLKFTSNDPSTPVTSVTLQLTVRGGPAQ